MIHVLLMILKIIGIILAVILGLLLLIVCLVLFVPVRYKIRASYNEELTARADVTWLFHLVRFNASYDKDVHINLRAAWFTLFSTDKETKKVDNNNKKEKKVKKEKDNHLETAESEEKQPVTEKTDITETISEQKNVLDEIEEVHNVSSPLENHNECDESQQNEPENGNLEEKPKKSGETKKHKKKISFFEWYGNIFKKIKNKAEGIKKKVCDSFISIKNKIISLKDNTTGKIDSVLGKINDPQNRELVSFLWKQTKIVLRKIKPVKYRIHCHYGMEDPFTTGQIAVKLAAVYGMLGIRMDIEPDFDNKILEADLFLKGRIRLISLLIIGIRCYRNKLVRKIILKK